MKTKNQSNRLNISFMRMLNVVVTFCLVLEFGLLELHAQTLVADFTNEVTVLPDGSPTQTNSISLDAGVSFNLVVGVSAPEGLLVGSVTATVLWDGNLLTMSNPVDATLDGVGGTWFPLGSSTPIIVEPEGDSAGEITWSKGDLFGTTPGTGDFPFLKITFTANAALQEVNLTDIVHLTSGARASLITQPNVAPSLTDITGAIPTLEVEILNSSLCDDCGVCDDNPDNDNTTCAANVEAVMNASAICNPKNVSIHIYEPGTSTLVETLNTTVDVNGNFTFEVTISDSYDIYIKVDGYLRELYSNVALSTGPNDLGPLFFTAGDINNDNSINIQDFSAFSAAYGSSGGDPSYNELADFNCNNQIEISDFSLFSANYGSSGIDLPIQAVE